MNSRFLRDYIFVLIAAFVAALLVRQFFIAGYRVPTNSMAPTILSGDLILAWKPAYNIRIPFRSNPWMLSLPEHGDLVVFSYPQSPRVFSIKRVIGLPGDRVELKDNKLFVNGFESQYLAQDLHLEAQGFASQFQETIQFSAEQTDRHSHQILWAEDSESENESKTYGPTIVPPNEVFLLGDHRDSSDDSRFWGTVPMSSLHAKVWRVWLSLNWSDLHPALSLPTVRTERIFLRPQ